MLKKFLLFFLVLFALFSCSAAMAEPRLVTIHESVVNYINEESSDFVGEVSFDTARFFAFTLEVDDENGLPEIDYRNPPKFTLSGGDYSFWDSYNLQEVHDTEMSFDLAMSSSLVNNGQDIWWGTDRSGYVPTNSEGDWVHFLNAADDGFNRDSENRIVVTWQYPNSEEQGQRRIPRFRSTAKQLDTIVPCIEYETTGTLGAGDLVVKGIKWRFVRSNDISTPVSWDEDIHVQLRVCSINTDTAIFLNKEFKTISSGDLIQDSVSFDNEQQGNPWCTIIRYSFGDDDQIYQWRFITTTQENLNNIPRALGGSLSWSTRLKDGKADYTYAQYDGTDVSSVATWPDIAEAKYFTDTGELIIPDGGNFSIVDAEFGDVIKTYSQDSEIRLPISTYSTLGLNMMEFKYMTEGYRKADWNYLNDRYSTRSVKFKDPTGSLNGKTVKWEFTGEASKLNGEGEIYNCKTLEQQFDPATGFFPYIELISDDEGNLKEVNYRIVRSPDISQAYNPGVVCYLSVFVTCDGNSIIEGPSGESFTNVIENVDTNNFEANFLLEGKWTPKNPVKFGTYHYVIVNLQVYDKVTLTQEDYITIDFGDFIRNSSRFTHYIWYFTDYPPVAEIHLMNNSEFENVSTDSVAAAIDGFNATDNIQAVQREEVYEESGVDENVISYFENEDSELVGRFKQLYSESEGWVVTKVTLPDELYDNLQDVSADNLAIYSITDAELQEQAAISKHNNNFLNWFITPAFADSTTSKTGKFVNLDGSKLDKINSKELLMVSYLKGGQKSNMYLGLNASATSATPSGETKKDEEGKETNNNSAVTDNTTKDTVKDEGTETPSRQADTVDNVADDNTQDTQADNTGTNIPSGFDPSTGTFTTSANDTRTLEEIIAALGDNIVNVTSFKLNSLTITKLDSANLAKFINLTSLDLTGASALTEITLGSDSKIQFLNVAKNTAIQTISLAGSSIKDLDTNACTNLTSLNLENCKNLKTLNTKGCKNLKVLILSSCEKTLTTLNINGNSLLLIDLSNFGSQLTSLDVSGQVRDNLKVGKKINLKEFFNTSNDYSDNVTISEATNTSGDVLEWKITSGEIEFNGVPDKFKYYFNTGFTKITADFFASASSNDVSMDVSITSDGTTVDDEGVLGSSGGGCNLGIGIFVLSILGVLISKGR